MKSWLAHLIVLASVFLLLPLTADSAPEKKDAGKNQNDYVITINYELGMHCTGFDFTYCCVLPPYNSILTQVIKHGSLTGTGLPSLLKADPKNPEILVDGDKRYKLYYEHIDNKYSEGNKMNYWNVPFDIDADGSTLQPGDTVANGMWTHLYIYKDLEGTNPENTSEDAKKLFVGKQIQVPVDSGPTGQPVSGGYMKYSGDKGTIVYTKGPVLDNVPIVLTNPGIWEALGLPLTPFNDSKAASGIMGATEAMIQPFQQAKVTLVDAKTGNPVIGRNGKPVSSIGTNPIDVPNCDSCHSGENANGEKYKKYQSEKEYWKSRGASEYFIRLRAAAISILEIHDGKHGTDFTAKYNPGASSNRLGRGTVICQKCHADNVIGALNSKKVGDALPNAPAETKGNPISPLTEALHHAHQMNRPSPDSLGRTGSCQGCHPAHRQDGNMKGYPITRTGENTFAKADNRDAAGGCYVGRDVHSNPDKGKDVKTPVYLNAIGRYLKENVNIGADGKWKGLWCTNCHNQLSRELYQRDNLKNAFTQEGETLRNKGLDDIAKAIGVTKQELIDKYLDPKVPLEGKDSDSGVLLTWAKKRTVPDIAVIEVKDGGPVVAKDKDGDANVNILSANPAKAADFKNGLAVPYEAASHGRDYWLSAGEPHCADCHLPPFVEGSGGVAFPINQPGKYSLMRYSKGHSGITCQGCHESIHGLYPVTSNVDKTSYNQSAAVNPDGSHGPLKCGSCHEVNDAGVPLMAKEMGTQYDGKDISGNYDLAVKYIHASAPDKGGANP
ncbi:MAG: hypothetical protein HZA01_06625 [Nitrospinae bacterium]|nr:hypothetical protein [Nitrospinota bacterium]